MRYCIFIFVAISILESCNPQTKEPISCAYFKTGHFVFHGTANGHPSSLRIDRNDSTQIEYNYITLEETTLHIKWLSDCKYKLTYISSTGNYSKELLDYLRSAVLITTINKIDSNYYVFTTMEDTITIMHNDTMWVNHTP